MESENKPALSKLTFLITLVIIGAITFFIITLSCVIFITRPSTHGRGDSLEIQGHRGCRGLMPENSIAAFLKAIEIGVDTLEMDVVISKDNQVVVSHDPFLSPVICYGPNGINITNEEEARQWYKIYNMTYSEIELCDCGSKGNPDFPQQQKFPTSKPLLSTVISTVEDYIRENKILRNIHYSIEIKSKEGYDNVFHPPVPTFVSMVYNVINSFPINKKNRLIIQSFDVRALEQMKTIDPSIALSLLVKKDEPYDYKQKLSMLPFVPTILSPRHDLLDEDMLTYAIQRGMKVIPWTINSSTDMKRFTTIPSVTGFITDYPNIAVQLMKSSL